MAAITAIQQSRFGRRTSEIFGDYNRNGFFNLKFVAIDVAIIAVCVLVGAH